MKHPIDEQVIPDRARLTTAYERIAQWTHRTPVLTCESIDRMVGSRLLFKCENFQKVGAFKFRGATNAVFSLTDDEASRGVATHSSGNHAQALALAARNRGIEAHVVMPSTSAAPKRAAVEGYGARVVECAPSLEARETTLDAVLAETGATFIHPYDDYRIIAGQASATMELLEDEPDIEVIMAPVGGGGLLSGTALAAYFFSKGAKVIAAEPEGADDAFRSFQKGEIIPSRNPDTIADGLLTSLGKRNFPIIQRHVDEIVTVSEEGIVRAMRLVWERMKMIIEPSSAVPLAALLENRVNTDGQSVGIIISGGNVDLDRLPW